MDSSTATDQYVCPQCGERCTKAVLGTRGYRCPRCTVEVAHLDRLPNGAVRGVIGWLRTAGDVLAERYVVVGMLAKGGFAATYLVEDRRLVGKRRVLKEVPEGLYDERETALLGRLQHPNIPDVVDRFAADGMVYLVLEFGGSRTLEDVRAARGGRIGAAELLPWLRQLCDVLGYLHGLTPPVVHRDLKPQNVLIDDYDRVMLIDFGVAKDAVEFEQTRPLARSATHGFSPPEQVLATGTDQRSDVYALGATMYALLTGTIPVAAHERVAGRELTRPGAIVPAIPPALEDIVLRALDLNVNLRPQSIAELRRLLDALTPGRPTGLVTEEFGGRTVRLEGGPGTAEAGARRSRRRLVGGAVAGAVLLATAGVGIWALRAREPAGESPPVPVEAGRGPGSPPSPAAPPPPSVTAAEPRQPPAPAPPVDAPKATERPAVEPALAPARSGAGAPSAARKPGAATRAFEQARSRTETEATSPPPPPPRPRAAAPAVKATRAQPAAPPRRQPLPSAAWERKARGGQP
jgi:serine/threonine-protein kinase